MQVAGISACGAIAAYVLDYFRQREGALATIWITLAAANLCLIITESGIDVGGRPLMLCLMSFLSCTAVLFHLGCWATLQFRWVQMQYPPVVLAMERLVVSGGVTMCGPVIAWGAVAAVGAGAAPFYVAILLPTLYLTLSTPLPSSFYARDWGSSAGRKPKSHDLAAQVRVEDPAFAGDFFVAAHIEITY